MNFSRISKLFLLTLVFAGVAFGLQAKLPKEYKTNVVTYAIAVLDGLEAKNDQITDVNTFRGQFDEALKAQTDKIPDFAKLSPAFQFLYKSTATCIFDLAAAYAGGVQNQEQKLFFDGMEKYVQDALTKLAGESGPFNGVIGGNGAGELFREKIYDKDEKNLTELGTKFMAWYGFLWDQTSLNDKTTWKLGYAKDAILWGPFDEKLRAMAATTIQKFVKGSRAKAKLHKSVKTELDKLGPRIKASQKELETLVKELEAAEKFIKDNEAELTKIEKEAPKKDVKEFFQEVSEKEDIYDISDDDIAKIQKFIEARTKFKAVTAKTAELEVLKSKKVPKEELYEKTVARKAQLKKAYQAREVVSERVKKERDARLEEAKKQKEAADLARKQAEPENPKLVAAKEELEKELGKINELKTGRESWKEELKIDLSDYNLKLYDKQVRLLGLKIGDPEAEKIRFDLGIWGLKDKDVKENAVVNELKEKIREKLRLGKFDDLVLTTELRTEKADILKLVDNNQFQSAFERFEEFEKEVDTKGKPLRDSKVKSNIIRSMNQLAKYFMARQVDNKEYFQEDQIGAQMVNTGVEDALEGLHGKAIYELNTPTDDTFGRIKDLGEVIKYKGSDDLVEKGVTAERLYSELVKRLEFGTGPEDQKFKTVVKGIVGAIAVIKDKFEERKEDVKKENLGEIDKIVDSIGRVASKFGLSSKVNSNEIKEKLSNNISLAQALEKFPAKQDKINKPVMNSIITKIKSGDVAGINRMLSKY
ncbi:MAG: hypothetical protein P9X22_07550 [Candidatus Zapsychrus exili]|nr:hypothetical protein [Candidatus Zapsychrus exili]